MAVGNTSKIAINNEIVLMRQAVRQSRVAVVRKLIKEAKLLQARKHGDERVQEKCKRKAQRLLAEIAAMKKLKDDEISKFGITNTSALQEVLSNTSAEPATRVMTRVAFHKSLSARINKFKEKFPEYEQHLGPGRRKLSKIQRQANREARNALRKSGISGEINAAVSGAAAEPENEVRDEIIDEQAAESSNDTDDDSEDEIESAADNVIEENAAEQLDDGTPAERGTESDSILETQTPGSRSKKRKISEDSSEVEAADSEPSEKPKMKKDEVKEKCKTKDTAESSDLSEDLSEKSKTKPKKKKVEAKAPAEPKKSKTIKVISKEATVKRFTDLIDDKEPEERIELADVSSTSKSRDIKIEKEVDSFFMTENGKSEYLSVVVPKPKLCEDAEEDERFSQNHAARRQQNFHERNNKFFSKIDQRANGGYGDQFGGRAGGRQSRNEDGRRQRHDFGNGRGSSEQFPRNSNGAARPPKNGKQELEKKSEPKDEQLHPSWAARKKQQEILKQGFQGKKIVFDY